MTTYSSDSLGSVSVPDTNINMNVMLTACGGDGGGGGGGGEGILGVGKKFPSDKLIKVARLWRVNLGSGVVWEGTFAHVHAQTQTKAHTHTPS